MLLKVVIRRILLIFPMLIGITFISFAFISMAPGDYLSTLKMNPLISPETIEEMRRKFGLDKPFYLQYLYWLWRVIHLDLGESFFYRAKVIDLISSRAFNTLILSLSSIFFAWLIGIPLGIISAIKKDTIIDRIIQTFSFVWMSFPSFFLAFLLLLLVVKTGILPPGGTISSYYYLLSPVEKVYDRILHLILPTAVLSSISMAGIVRLMRGYYIQALNENSVLFAKAKGLPLLRVYFVHALRLAINPFITLLGYEISSLLSGAALVETVLNLQGLGTLMLKAVLSQDIYLIMGGVLTSSLLLMLGNLIADILLLFADPRARME